MELQLESIIRVIDLKETWKQQEQTKIQVSPRVVCESTVTKPDLYSNTKKKRKNFKTQNLKTSKNFEKIWKNEEKKTKKTSKK